MFSKGIGPIFVRSVFFCMEPATDTELLYFIHALVRNYARHLQDASMLVELNKDDFINFFISAPENVYSDTNIPILRGLEAVILTRIHVELVGQFVQ